MSDQHKDDIWQRGDARKIMREARVRFRRDLQVEKSPGAHLVLLEQTPESHVALASTHYSLVKRYLAPAPIWMRPLAVWHMRRAVVHVKKADRLGFDNYDQVDVAATILTKAPWWLGGDINRALYLVEDALFNMEPLDEMPEMLPHTRSFLEIRMAEILMRKGRTPRQVARWYRSAYEREGEINSESDADMAWRQWVRIASDCGFFFYDHGLGSEGQYLIRTALVMSRGKHGFGPSSLDQEKKILAEMHKRGLSESHIQQYRVAKGF